ncbi:MAG: trypsin-like peptidase domain-containing protein [Selenomonadaceae bacterium]|nr:trypsin-like peptidase domain-containing protein [Selenomonadaceae bacterium]MDY2686326.1 trypsin-like peptidase domain-containing protein [Selenomonadaceae bacterium]
MKIQAKKKTIFAVVIAALVLLGGAFYLGYSHSEAPTASTSQTVAQRQQSSAEELTGDRKTAIVTASEKVGPAVVGIANKAQVQSGIFRKQSEEETQGEGSGVIIRSDGYIVTNNHVVNGADSLTVSLADGRTLDAKVVGTDELTDLAVVKVEAEDLPTAVLGDSDKTVVGEPAIAIGNPLGEEFSGSVTAGVISALNRTIEEGGSQLRLLQTDAAINPGNSGGALVNADGEVIGINSAKLVQNGVEGMGFAIPSNTVKRIADQLIEKGHVTRPYLGASVIDANVAAQYGYQVSGKGVFLVKLVPGGPADKAGLSRGDILTQVDDQKVETIADLHEALEQHAVGDKVTVTFDRNGSQQTASVTLAEMPASSN